MRIRRVLILFFCTNLISCGYEIPEGDKYPEIPPFEIIPKQYNTDLGSYECKSFQDDKNYYFIQDFSVTITDKNLKVKKVIDIEECDIAYINNKRDIYYEISPKYYEPEIACVIKKSHPNYKNDSLKLIRFDYKNNDSINLEELNDKIETLLNTDSLINIQHIGKQTFIFSFPSADIAIFAGKNFFNTIASSEKLIRIELKTVTESIKAIAPFDTAVIGNDFISRNSFKLGQQYFYYFKLPILNDSLSFKSKRIKEVTILHQSNKDAWILINDKVMIFNQSSIDTLLVIDDKEYLIAED